MDLFALDWSFYIMEKISSILYGVQQGLKNIWRNKLFSIASIGTISACLFLFGIFYFIIGNFSNMVKNAESSICVTVFFDEKIGEKRVKEIGQEIKKRGEVAQVNYKTAEEAWEEFKEKELAGKEELAETFEEDNPLVDSSSYEVYINDASKQPSLVKYIKAIDGVRQVNSSDATAKGFASFNMLVGYISLGIIVILLAVACFLISTSITMGISIRKEEIAIMRLVGAKDSFVQAPFIVEGILIGFAGAVIPLLFLRILYNQIIEFIAGKYQALTNWLVFLDVNTIFSVLIPLSLAIGVGIGLIGSLITVWKHLRVN